MKIVVSWLRDFVDVTASPEELGETLTLRGFELSSIERVTIDDGRSTIDDAVLDFEVTANRPDALSVIGFAREVGTAYSLPVKPLVPKPLPSKPTSDVAVKLEAPDLCPRYAAAVADVTIAPSPAWLASRLQAAGVRPINNVVDVTNYVLLELGQPMHAFDLEKLAGSEIRIRRAAPGERITTLDGVDRALDPEMLVIADGDKAQAVAGVMGGGRSEVSEHDEDDRARERVFRSQKRSPDEQEARAEDGSLGPVRAGRRRQRGRQRPRARDDAPRGDWRRAARAAAPSTNIPCRRRSAKIELRRARIDAHARPGRFQRPTSNASSKDSGFRSARATRGWDVAVPTFRVDVLREVDLIEEVARHYGYDRLPVDISCARRAALRRPIPRIERDRLVRRVLLAAGCSEALTFSFIDAAAGRAVRRRAGRSCRSSNPLSAQFSVLRPSLLPGLLASVAHNRHRERPDVRLFELGASDDARR